MILWLGGGRRGCSSYQPGLERVQRETLYSNGTVIKTNDVSKVTIQRNGTYNY